MFWRKKSAAMEQQSELVQLVELLGIEKRQFTRVRYPRLAQVCKLPEISFAGHKMLINDISIGGCCLLDPKQYLGAAVGVEIELCFHWMTGDEALHARLVSRVDHRRHFQFIGLSERRQSQLRKAMASGERGLAMRRSHEASNSGPGLDARELWSSALGDSLVLESGVHRLAILRLDGEEYLLYREARPVSRGGQRPCLRPQFEQIILFLVNFPNPSPLLTAMIVDLELHFSNEVTESGE